MGKQTLEYRIKEILGYAAWKIYLWSIDRTAEQYWHEIYLQEKEMEAK